jgi:hypothetical protein
MIFLIIYDQQKTNEQIILHQINKVDKNLRFIISTEENNTIHYLDISIYRNNKSINIGIYRKPTETGMVIHLTSIHPYEQKISAFTYYINRLITLPTTDKSKQHEWEKILAIAKKNGYPTNMIHNLKRRLTIRKQSQKRQEEETVPRKKWVTFTHFSPLIRRVTNLFKHTNLRVTFHAINTIQQQLTEKKTYKDPCGIYKLKCNTCNRVYVGQLGRATHVRYKEHIRYIRTNNPKSHLQHTYWTIGMNTEQKKTQYNYCRHVRKEHAWIAGRHYTYRHFINKKS